MSRKPEQETIDKMIDLYSKRYSAKEIGEKLNLTPPTVTKYLKENGIKIRTIKKHTRHD